MKNYYAPEANNFSYARKNKGICNLSYYTKITIYGPNAIDLINSFSIRNVENLFNSDNSNAIYTIFMKKKKFITEGFIIKLSQLKYVILTEDFTSLLKYLRKRHKNFKLVTIEQSSSQFCFFSLHGDKCIEKNKLTHGNIYEVNHQGYNYFLVLSGIVNKYNILDHYVNMGYVEISKEVYNLFLNSNSVMTKLDKINKRYKIPTYLSIINADNFKVKVKKKYVSIKQFETTKNLIVTRDMPIYNHERKKIGFVHNFYRLVNKKFPFIICVLNKNKHEKIAIIKNNDQEILIKEYNKY